MHKTKSGFESIQSYVWCPNSLYHAENYVDVVIMQMLDRAAPKDQIQMCLEELKASNHINDSKYTKLVRNVLSTAGEVVDEGLITAPQNQLPILTSGEVPQNILERRLLNERLSILEDKMQRRWDVDANCYRLYHQFTPPRRVPSQYLAFDQLRLRFLKGQPILVSILAPAGYGKSELLSAWLNFTALHG